MAKRPSEVHSSWGDVQDPRRDIVTVSISNGVRLPLHKDIAAIVKLVLEECLRRGYTSFHKGNTWGLAVRLIRGSSSTWSAHSYGTALDVASDKNPMKKPLTTDMPGWVVELFKQWGFRWGGDWQNRPDPMHYSFAGTRQEAQALNAKAAQMLGQAPPPVAPAPVSVGSRPVIRKRAKGHHVTHMQNRLNAHSKNDGRLRVKVDGDFGPASDKAIRFFQEDVRLKVDGIVGSKTWAALDSVPN